MPDRFEEVDTEFVEALKAKKREIRNMDLERQETEIQKICDSLVKSNNKQLKEALKEAHRVGYLTKKEYQNKWKGRYIGKLPPNKLSGFP